MKRILNRNWKVSKNIIVTCFLYYICPVIIVTVFYSFHISKVSIIIEQVIQNVFILYSFFFLFFSGLILLVLIKNICVMFYDNSMRLVFVFVKNPYYIWLTIFNAKVTLLLVLFYAWLPQISRINVAFLQRMDVYLTCMSILIEYKPIGN